MKKLIVLMMITLFAWSINMQAQDKTKKDTKTTTTQSQVKSNDKPAQADKVVAGKKGPNGEAVYQGAQGGQYYINKNGNKTYLKDTDKVVEGKKGPNGETVYVGPKGGQYYLNKNGEKVYLSNEKK
jgi:colicin import membrane protein